MKRGQGHDEGLTPHPSPWVGRPRRVPRGGMNAIPSDPFSSLILTCPRFLIAGAHMSCKRWIMIGNASKWCSQLMIAVYNCFVNTFSLIRFYLLNNPVLLNEYESRDKKRLLFISKTSYHIGIGMFKDLIIQNIFNFIFEHCIISRCYDCWCDSYSNAFRNRSPEISLPPC